MSQALLPKDPQAAVEKLIDITRHLAVVMRDEARSLSLKNEAGMLDAEKLKEKMLPQYQQAAQEFSMRMEEFRSVDKSLLDELQGLQDELGAIARENQFYLAS